MDPQQVTEHDYPHDDEECPACGGTEQIEIVLQDHSRDYVACPLCLARDKNEAIAGKDAEIAKLRAALDAETERCAMVAESFKFEPPIERPALTWVVEAKRVIASHIRRAPAHQPSAAGSGM